MRGGSAGNWYAVIQPCFNLNFSVHSKVGVTDSKHRTLDAAHDDMALRTVATN